MLKSLLVLMLVMCIAVELAECGRGGRKAKICRNNCVAANDISDPNSVMALQACFTKC